MDITLREVLSGKGADVHSVPPAASVQDAVAVMVENGIGSVLVMTDDQLTGLFTERDLMTRVVHEGLDPGTTPVRQVMTTEIATVSPDLRADEAMAICTQRRLRHLPVFEGGELVGIVSTGDLTKAAVRHQEHTIEELYHYIYGA